MGPYLSHDGWGEQAVVIHPAVHTGLRVQVSHVGEGPIQVKELPLGVEEATTFLWLEVWVQWDGDSQEDIRAEDPSGITRDSGIIEDVDPAAMARNGCCEVLQQWVTDYYHVNGESKNYLNHLEFPQATNFIQKLFKGHSGQVILKTMHNDFKAISSMEEKISFHEFTLSLYNLTTVSHKWVPSPHYCNREVETVSPVLLKSQGIIFF